MTTVGSFTFLRLDRVTPSCASDKAEQCLRTHAHMRGCCNVKTAAFNRRGTRRRRRIGYDRGRAAYFARDMLKTPVYVELV